MGKNSGIPDLVLEKNGSRAPVNEDLEYRKTRLHT